MAKRFALGYLAAAPLLILLVFFVPGVPSWLLAPVVMGLPVAFVVQAVSRDGSVKRLAAPLVLLFLMLQTGAAGVLIFSGSGATRLGLPVALHSLLFLVWLGPLIVTTLSYAWLFAELGIDDDVLARVSEMRAARDRGEPR